MTTAREDTTRLAELLRREHHALAEFLVALSVFHRERRWSELGYASLFDFLRRELKLSAGAAQYRKTAAELIRAYPEIEAALRRGDLCLTSVIEVSKVITSENAAEILPRFFGKSARDAAFVAASIRPIENPPKRDFLVTPVRSTSVDAALDVTAGAFRAPEVEFGSAPDAAPIAGRSPSPSPLALAAPSSSAAPDRPKVRPLDAERARINMTVSRRLLEKLATARDALSHSHPGASEETILELGLDLIIQRHHRSVRAPEAAALLGAGRGRVHRAARAGAAPATSRPLPRLRAGGTLDLPPVTGRGGAHVRTASRIVSAALVAALCACGGGSSSSGPGGGGGADTFSLTIYGASTEYRDSTTGISILAYASGPLTTVSLSGTGIVATVSIPAGQTGNVVGAFDAVIGGNHCYDGTVTVNVTAHGTALGSTVAGSLGPVSMTCPIGPSPQTVSASFSATHL